MASSFGTGRAQAKLLALETSPGFSRAFLLQNGWQCRHVPCVTEMRLRRLDHFKLAGLCSLVAAQLTCEA